MECGITSNAVQLKSTLKTLYTRDVTNTEYEYNQCCECTVCATNFWAALHF